LDASLSPQRDDVFVFGTSSLIETAHAQRTGAGEACAATGEIGPPATARRVGSPGNKQWPNSACPYCNHRGVTNFDFISHRRSWYACPECKKVWIGKRQEDF
jgi:hypothetical protein